MRFMILIEYFGPNYQILKHMSKKLFIFLFLISILVVPYSFIYHTIIHGTEEFGLSVILKAFYNMMWTIFLNIRQIVAQVREYPVQSDGTTVYSVTSTFLFVSFPLYVLACNILLLNLIIASFAYVDFSTSNF